MFDSDSVRTSFRTPANGMVADSPIRGSSINEARNYPEPDLANQRKFHLQCIAEIMASVNSLVVALPPRSGVSVFPSERILTRAF